MQHFSLKFLKFIVVLMGILIVIGFVVLGVELAKRIKNKSKTPSQTQTVETYLNLPEGARISRSFAENNRLFFVVCFPDETAKDKCRKNRLYITESKTGKIIHFFDTGFEPRPELYQSQH